MHTIANLSKRQMAYVTAITTHAPSLGIDTNKTEFSRAELRQVSMSLKGKKWIPNWITHDQSRRTSRGVFSIPEVMESLAVTPGEEIEGDGLADVITETTEEMELITA